MTGPWEVQAGREREEGANKGRKEAGDVGVDLGAIAGTGREQNKSKHTRARKTHSRKQWEHRVWLTVNQESTGNTYQRGKQSAVPIQQVTRPELILGKQGQPKMTKYHGGRPDWSQRGFRKDLLKKWWWSWDLLEKWEWPEWEGNETILQKRDHQVKLLYGKRDKGLEDS